MEDKIIGLLMFISSLSIYMFLTSKPIIEKIDKFILKILKKGDENENH